MIALVLPTALALAVGSPAADAQTVCRNATGTHAGHFYTLWHDTGETCIELREKGGYRVHWKLGQRGNMVAGKGWATGRKDRIVRYQARSFDPGTNGYLTLYGWTTRPLVEYYVVDNWGSFTPPGSASTFLGTVKSDGGTYRIYRTQRVDQPSIAGTATFPQYWSVRTERRPLAKPQAITFANHVAAWRKAGLHLGTMHYQVLATEGFGSDGRSDIRLLTR